MPNLKSVSNRDGARESMESAVAEELVLPGGVGANPADIGRSAKVLLKSGKSAGVAGGATPAPGENVVALSILGEDDRTRILETDMYPWRMICALKINDGRFIGTGWLAGPDTIVTAGHCVYHKSDLGGWAKNITVIPALDGDVENPPLGNESVQTSTTFFATDAWQADQDPDFDIGCIKLDEPIGNDLGWFATAALADQELEEHLVNISGYPGDKPKHSFPKGNEQWFHSNRIHYVSPRRIYYDVDTMGGQSGSPVWIYRSTSDQPEVVGVHAYGEGRTPGAVSSRTNSAPRITANVFELIKEWVDGA